MNKEDWRDVLGDELAVNLEIPAAFCDRSATTGDAAAHLLDAIAVLEDGAQGQKPEDPPADIQRLELKIDLLTDLVSSLLTDRVPTPVNLWISREGLVCPAALMEPGCGSLQLYPSQWLAQPLVLELDELRVRGDACGGLWRSPDSALRDALGRWVFRMHRREVARRRMNSGVARAD
ncbi:PilZ domain-containing protein [Thiocystis violacea]|uniref:PilZ domain-containing protein n=1 Tax=Thiocystis violacea TaxID=13725 RepID=UPI001906EEB1|nr:PilZ domain-containing protein [Thiocystis violacea]MBK1721320.1 hypothetical protein [Thiocystis violacea]